MSSNDAIPGVSLPTYLLACLLLALPFAAGCSSPTAPADTAAQSHDSSNGDTHGESDDNIVDPWVRRLVSLTANRTPAPPDPGSFENKRCD